MIFDTRDNLLRYMGIHKNLDTALKWINETDLRCFHDSTFEIEGKKVYGFIQEYPTKPKESISFESHNRYIDIQYVISGKEIIEFAKTSELTITDPYNDQKDICFYDGQIIDEKRCVSTQLNQDQFVICFPDDGHRPMIGDGNMVKKMVLKVLY